MPVTATLASLALHLAPALLPASAGGPLPPEPVAGTLVLASPGPLAECVPAAVIGSCPGGPVDVVVIGGDRGAEGRWSGADGVTRIKLKGRWGDAQTLAMLEAEVVWFEEPADRLWRKDLFRALLENHGARGGVIGGVGEAATFLVESAGLLPGSKAMFVGPDESDEAAAERLAKQVEPGAGEVAWAVPSGAALFVHGGRWVAPIGAMEAMAHVPASGDWPARSATFEGQDAYDSGDELPRSADLLAWVRTAQDRMGPLFPEPECPAPEVPKGTLVISGGGGVQSPTWRRFIEAAGGKDATIVCIPSAGSGERPDSYSHRHLSNHGCTNVHVLHAGSASEAETSERLHALLGSATGVWIDGGRTYRVMDLYQNTRCHELMRAVLAKGGAVGGSSAGCQVAGDFLLRGNPRTNKTLVYDGYTRGLGFLRGVIIDAHFRDRQREAAFEELMGEHPGRLGIGIDGDTALVIEGTVAEVMGLEGVTFYDGAKDELEPVLLKEGERYDLGERARIR